MLQKNNKNIVILGPTSSGKTGMAVKLAYDFDGEIISADSRQVYRGMDIGTGKDLGEYSFEVLKNNKKQQMKIPHHLIDVVDPMEVFDLASFVKSAKSAIKDIRERGKLPIIAGGTGLYTQALVDDYKLSITKPDEALRAELEKLDAKTVFLRLKKLNPEFAESLNDSEKNNRRRLIRYVEIEKSKDDKDRWQKNISKRQDYLLIGIKCPREVLYQRIEQRLKIRIEKEGMIEEVKRLHERDGISWQRLQSFGLEYKYVSLYLQSELDYDKMLVDLAQAIRKFSKRQMTWYRRWEKQGALIHWVKDYQEAKGLVEEYFQIKIL
jgi:tRNA dimethylallyltransferase